MDDPRDLGRWLNRGFKHLGVQVVRNARLEELAALERLSYRLDRLEKVLLRRLDEVEARADIRHLLAEDRERDAVILLERAHHFLTPTTTTIRTDHPIATDSDDHTSPYGTANDNTRHPRFVRACEEMNLASIKDCIRHVDLGCAGGGLVWDFVMRGHDSYGVEGSDYSLRAQRAEWRLIPERLFTADITQPFSLVDNDDAKKFDLVTAWEVLEHIPEDRLGGLFDNIVRLLRPGGLFVGSVATFESVDPVSGAVYHQTLKDEAWWIELAHRSGLEPIESPFDTSDYVRGADNPRKPGWDVRVRPDLGFHLVCRVP